MPGAALCTHRVEAAWADPFAACGATGRDMPCVRAPCRRARIFCFLALAGVAGGYNGATTQSLLFDNQVATVSYPEENPLWVLRWPFPSARAVRLKKPAS